MPAVVDTREATTRVDPLLHESWGDNVFIERDVDGGDIETARSAADVTVTNEFRSTVTRQFRWKTVPSLPCGTADATN